MGETRRLSHDHPDARTTIVAGGELLDLAIVQRDPGGGAVLDEDLGEVASLAKGGRKNALEDVALDEMRYRSLADGAGPV